jgi:hypothetical protein
MVTARAQFALLPNDFVLDASDSAKLPQFAQTQLVEHTQALDTSRRQYVMISGRLPLSLSYESGDQVKRYLGGWSVLRPVCGPQVNPLDSQSWPRPSE